MNKTFLLITLIFFSLSTYAQNFNFGAITHDDYSFDRNKLDSNANAVVLKEFGTSSIQISERTGGTELIFEYHVKIKIYNKEGYRQANVVIPTYKNGSREEFINTIKASTFNFENGRFVESIMDKKAIFTENKTRYTVLHCQILKMAL